ncbi:hypothetical protein [Neolewinella persica]|uniref:hypothetical protein n=1 Tax=Neolewinella persica TaxID=70998 RepID=UPI000373B41D|nr:hypothetical protein [Neolewinella persica]
MQHSAFLSSLTDPAPPEGCRTEIAAIWWLKNRNWQLAHDLIDEAPGRDAAWIHALLHRMEGDQPMASYWYARAGRSAPENTIGQELALMMDHFLD